MSRHFGHKSLCLGFSQNHSKLYLNKLTIRDTYGMYKYYTVLLFAFSVVFALLILPNFNSAKKRQGLRNWEFEAKPGMGNLIQGEGEEEEEEKTEVVREANESQTGGQER